MFLLGNKFVYIEKLRRVEKGIPLMSIPAPACLCAGAQDLSWVWRVRAAPLARRFATDYQALATTMHKQNARTLQRAG